MLKRAEALLVAGEVDQAVDLLVRWGSHRNTEGLPELCKLTGKFVRAGVALAPKFGFREREGLTRLTSFSRFGAEHNHRMLWSREPLGISGEHRALHGVVRAPAVLLTTPATYSLILANGAVWGREERLLRAFACNLIVANGPVQLDCEVGQSVIVADGHVTLRRGAAFCVIIARGPVTCRGHVQSCVVVSGKAIDFEHRAYESVVKANDPFPLELVRFFDPKRVGVEVEKTKAGVEVKSVARGKAFAAAGLAVGDVIDALDGQEVADREAFRRALRPHAAEQGTFTLSFRRDGKRREARVSLAP
jgi:hypothetical protein